MGELFLGAALSRRTWAARIQAFNGRWTDWRRQCGKERVKSLKCCVA